MGAGFPEFTKNLPEADRSLKSYTAYFYPADNQQIVFI